MHIGIGLNWTSGCTVISLLCHLSLFFLRTMPTIWDPLLPFTVDVNFRCVCCCCCCYCCCYRIVSVSLYRQNHLQSVMHFDSFVFIFFRLILIFRFVRNEVGWNQCALSVCVYVFNTSTVFKTVSIFYMFVGLFCVAAALHRCYVCLCTQGGCWYTFKKKIHKMYVREWWWWCFFLVELHNWITCIFILYEYSEAFIYIVFLEISVFTLARSMAFLFIF